ncbi:hypothetical protein LTR56_027194 [Elasticomyces elasticus]|nr:hypothetical protein LTR56_027194 [Elasticomyces elasticus]KAK3615857.1 hypothetical protein LTR22_027269 [Elasticomyces elasticus]KAK4899045.1 hypothetical protein LTR49_027715 [Elasticomyces elasticus]
MGAASAPNNGSYTFYSEGYNSLYFTADWPYLYGVPSGCNYTFSLKCWTDEVYSPYFAIMNPVDDGLSTNATCPQDEGIFRPSNGTYEPNTSSTSGSNVSQNSGGITPSTLIIAVIVPIALLVLAFGFLLWLSFRRGWIVVRGGGPSASRQDSMFMVSSNSKEGATVQEAAGTEALLKREEPSELTGVNLRYQVAGAGVHQLHGEESRRALH